MKYKCPMCDFESLDAFHMNSGAELLKNQAGEATGVGQGEPDITVVCGRGCILRTKGRDAVRRVLGMMNPALVAVGATPA